MSCSPQLVGDLLVTWSKVHAKVQYRVVIGGLVLDQDVSGKSQDG